MNEPLLQIYPCKPEDVEALVKSATADSHEVVSPSFLLYKVDQIVGYIGYLPTIMVWLDSERCGIRDSLVTQNFWENHLRAQGIEVVGVACDTASPLHPYLGRVGYVGRSASLFFKNLNRR